MTIYDDLSAEFSAWREAYFGDQRSSFAFADLFVNTYRDYIGAPKSFRNGFDRDADMSPYVFPCSVELNEEEHTFVAHKEDTVVGALTDGKDHRWYFAIATTMEMASTTYPKQWFPQLCSFYLDGRACHLRVTSNPEGEFTLDLDNPTSFYPAYDYMVHLHKREMRKRRTDLVSPARRYGFALQPTPLPTQTAPVVDEWATHYGDD